MPTSLLPIRSRPIEGEELTSWLTRIATQYNLPLHELIRTHFSSAQGIIDLDVEAPMDFLGNVSTALQVSTPEILGMTYKEEVAYVLSYPSTPNSDWLTQPNSDHHGAKRQQPFAFCSGCFKSDPVPFYRKSWRYGFYTNCPKHGVLTTHCSSCATLHSHHKPGDRTVAKPNAIHIGTCLGCGKTLFNEPQQQLPQDIAEELLSFQERLLTAVDERFIEVPGYGQMHTRAFLQGIGILLRGLVRLTNAERLNFEEQLGIAPPVDLGKARFHSFTHLPPLERAWLLYQVVWLLEEWPARLESHNYILRGNTKRVYWLSRIDTPKSGSKRDQYGDAGNSFFNVTGLKPTLGQLRHYKATGKVIARQHGNRRFGSLSDLPQGRSGKRGHQGRDAPRLLYTAWKRDEVDRLWDEYCIDEELLADIYASATKADKPE